MTVADPNRVVLTGENPFIRLSETDGAPFGTNASFWRIITSGAGPGHVLYIKSELTADRWRIYADNIWSPDGTIAPAGYDLDMDVVAKTGAFTKKVPYDDVVDMQFVHAAQKK